MRRSGRHPTIFDAKGKLVERMFPDGVIRDHLGTVLARYAAGSLPGDGTPKEPSSDRTFALRVVLHDPRDVSLWPEWLDFGYRIRVTDTNDVVGRATRPRRTAVTRKTASASAAPSTDVESSSVTGEQGQ